jgi:hypothetical protein
MKSRNVGREKYVKHMGEMNGAKSSPVYLHGLDLWVPVTKTRSFICLRLEQRPAVWRVAANILNKQLWTADKGW